MSNGPVEGAPHPRRWSFLRVFRIALFAPFLLLILCWIFLYGDSIYQRRKAEKVLHDLKSFPFATANFVEVREFVIAHGGSPNNSELVYRAPNMGAVPPDETGVGHVVFYREDGGPCTPQNCTFQVVIRNGFWLEAEHDWLRRLAVDFDGFGVRPWVTYLRLEVSAGRLNSTSITVASGVAASWNEWTGTKSILIRTRNLLSPAESSQLRCAMLVVPLNS